MPSSEMRILPQRLRANMAPSWTPRAQRSDTAGVQGLLCTRHPRLVGQKQAEQSARLSESTGRGKQTFPHGKKPVMGTARVPGTEVVRGRNGKEGPESPGRDSRILGSEVEKPDLFSENAAQKVKKGQTPLYSVTYHNRRDSCYHICLHFNEA